VLIEPTIFLARSFQLQDAIAVLELDRVLDADPDDLDQHRLGLKAARQKRLELIARSTENLTARIHAASVTANSTVVLHPIASREVVDASNFVSVSVTAFRGRLGIEGGHESREAKRWVDAVVELKDHALETGAGGVDAAARFGNDTLDRAKSATGKLSDKIAERARQLRGNAAEDDA
jgi:hypothetical protein